ncbi:uncharacterized protein LOC127256618 [Andrographis paniculata]|uniref:uncharacterized protein LOC127256618 n=1 Tax=Andrographis paniculata TaxID=175694 RepID=UPI0021E85B6C|nr:uncharacterized protein LOC127256618 [Andrographis paniculata]
MATTAVVALASSTRMHRCYDSMLGGEEFTHELINGHPARIKNLLRVSSDTFQDFCATLVEKGLLECHSRQRVKVQERVAIFLHTVAHSNRQRSTAERFQHSTSTICDHVNEVAKALVRLAPHVIRPGDMSSPARKIRDSPIFWPYFKDCVGAMDGTLVHACLPYRDQRLFRGRRGDTMQNCLTVCDFDMKFTYVLAGLEGSAHDACVLRVAIRELGDFPFPPDGKYYIGDSGYMNAPQCLTPYRTYRYHLSDFQGNNPRPRGKEEYFNYQHPQCRNVIECAFGCLKHRFAILHGPMPNYKFDRQVNFVMACAIVHNFMLLHGEDVLDHAAEGHDSTDEKSVPQPVAHNRQTPNPGREDRENQNELCDMIADWLWINRYEHKEEFDSLWPT